MLLSARSGGVLARLGPLLLRPSAGRFARWRAAVRSGRDRRSREAELARLAESLAGAVGVGMSVPAALENAARQVAGPLRNEVEQVLKEYHLGISLSGALRSWKVRARSADVDLLVETLELIRQVGGSMSGPLAQVASTLERRRRDRQEAWAHMAEARMSAAVVASVPPLMLGLLARGQSEPWQALVGTAPGHLALAFAAGSWSVGVLITLLLLRPPR